MKSERDLYFSKLEEIMKYCVSRLETSLHNPQSGDNTIPLLSSQIKNDEHNKTSSRHRDEMKFLQLIVDTISLQKMNPTGND